MSDAELEARGLLDGLTCPADDKAGQANLEVLPEGCTEFSTCISCRVGNIACTMCDGWPGPQCARVVEV